MKRAKITLTNRSEWSTAALAVISNWIVERAGITWKYSITVKACKSNTYGGRGGVRSQRIWIDRNYRRRNNPFVGKVASEIETRIANTRKDLADTFRRGRANDDREYEREEMLQQRLRRLADDLRAAPKERRPLVGGRPLWPLTDKDRRFKWAAVHSYRTRFEALIMLIAHEAYHATGGDPAKFTDRKTGKTNADLMEFRCNDFAMKTVEAARENWPALRPLIVAAMRRERQQINNLRSKKSDAVPKLQRIVKRRLMWERKARRAARAIQKLKKQEKYYIGKIAAKGK